MYFISFNDIDYSKISISHEQININHFVINIGYNYENIINNKFLVNIPWTNWIDKTMNGLTVNKRNKYYAKIKELQNYLNTIVNQYVDKLIIELNEKKYEPNTDKHCFDTLFHKLVLQSNIDTTVNIIHDTDIKMKKFNEFDYKSIDLKKNLFNLYFLPSARLYYFHKENIFRIYSDFKLEHLDIKEVHYNEKYIKTKLIDSTINYGYVPNSMKI